MQTKILQQNRIFFANFYVTILLFLIFFIFGLLIYNYTYVTGDLGEYVNNAFRVYNGEIPYKDFWLLFPPGEVYLPAFLYRIFGLNVNVILVSWVIVGALVGAISFALGKILFNGEKGADFFAVLLAILMFFNGLGHVYFLLLIVATVFFIKFLKSETFDSGGLSLFISGIFVGLAFYFRFFEVAAYGLAAGIILIVNSVWKRMHFLKILKVLAIFVCGFLLAVFVFYLPLFEYWKLIFKSVVLDSLKHGTSMNLPYFGDIKHALKDLIGWNGVGGFTVYRLLFFLRIVSLYFLPFAVLLIGGSRLFNHRIKRFGKILIFFLMLWVLFELPKAFGRSDISHLAHAASPAIVLVLFLFVAQAKWIWKIFLGGFVVALFFQIPIRIYDTAKILNTAYYEVKTNYGVLMLDKQNEAENIQQVLKFIEDNSQEGDYIFVSSWYFPAFYALTNRQNPTYYDSLIDLVAQPSEEKQKIVCDGLLGKISGYGPAKLIIHNSYWKFDDKETLSFNNTNPILENCIKNNFKLVKTYGDYDLYLP